jgi:hypothetical protein
MAALWLAGTIGQKGSDVPTKVSRKFSDALRLLTTMTVAFSGHVDDADNSGRVVPRAMLSTGKSLDVCQSSSVCITKTC